MSSDAGHNILHDIFNHISLQPLLKLVKGLRPGSLYKLIQRLFYGISSRNFAASKPRNLWQLLEKAAFQASDHGISIYSPGQISQVGFRLTYRQLLEQSQIKARMLSEIEGMSSESIVLLHFDTHMEGISWFWAVVAAGYIPAISTPFTHDLEARKKHLVHLQNVLRNPVILTSERLVAEFLDLEGLNIHTVESLQAGKESNLSASPITSRGGLKNGDNIAVLMLTSGSTGHAKAVALRHGQLLTSIRGKSIHHTTTKNDRFLNWIGIDHVANLTETHLHSMHLAADQFHVQASDLLVDPLRFLALIDRHRITHTFAPNFFLASLRTSLAKFETPSADFHPDLSCLRVLISGGEQTVVETCQALTTLLAKYKCAGEVIRPGFGMTETCAGSIYNKDCPSYDISQKSEFASLGSCVPGISMRITDDSGNIVTKNEIGNLEVSGPIVFKDYFNNAKATAESFTKDGWFMTGDRALIDSTGRLQVRETPSRIFHSLLLLQL
jgi:acyl-CoA synthetase (AMP-forming)/AMP-acid ligase II